MTHHLRVCTTAMILMVATPPHARALEFRLLPLLSTYEHGASQLFPLGPDMVWTYRVREGSAWTRETVTAHPLSASDAPSVDLETAPSSVVVLETVRGNDVTVSREHRALYRSPSGNVWDFDLVKGGTGGIRFPSSIQREPVITVWGDGYEYWIADAAEVEVEAGSFTSCVVVNAVKRVGPDLRARRLVYCEDVGLVLETESVANHRLARSVWSHKEAEASSVHVGDPLGPDWAVVRELVDFSGQPAGNTTEEVAF